jgi:2-keto-4-pentenoate hydratase/2-oxohepta-3-ene-1,7-dioic acid hydratase in catechol pathway
MLWMRFSHGLKTGFGVLEDDKVRLYRGDMFSAHERTDELVDLAEIRWEIPCAPTKMLALWNNFHQAAAKFSLSVPPEPLFFLKGANSFCAHGANIRVPRSYSGRVLYEGELGVVIGKTGKDIPVADAGSHIFGYTCVNDVTAMELLKADPSFPQWTRAKSFDGFGPFGPVIGTDIDPAELVVRTLINGKERQHYAVRDMIFSPTQLVSLLSRDLTLFPGDIISCGTSVGSGAIPAGATVEVVIDGIGMLSNRYV